MNKIFENLFILELANNHWGDVNRGIKIIRDHAKIVRHNNVRASIKLQFREVDNFIHDDFKGNTSERYIAKTEKTKLSKKEFKILVDEIKDQGCIPMATPFDEASVELIEEFEMPMVKIASSDINDWPLIETIARLRKPVIISSGGASEKDLDDVVNYFANRDIPLAINHCVSLYPSEDSDLNLNQIDYLKQRYTANVIGFSTHEYTDWTNSMLISYAKGVRTWERHIDIDFNNVPVSDYCSKPEDIDVWFKAFHKAREMCGGFSESRRIISKKETEYLDKLVRGVYAKRDIKAGYIFNKNSFEDDFFLAIPLKKGQLSCREIINKETLTKPIFKNEPLLIDHVDGPYQTNEKLRNAIKQRGIE